MSLCFSAESDTIPTLLITPETMLLSRGGSIQILPGIPRSSSIFSAPEQCNSKDVDIEKVGQLDH